MSTELKRGKESQGTCCLLEFIVPVFVMMEAPSLFLGSYQPSATLQAQGRAAGNCQGGRRWEGWKGSWGGRPLGGDDSS